MPYYFKKDAWSRRTMRRALLEAGQFAHVTEEQIDALLDKHGREKNVNLEEETSKCKCCGHWSYSIKKIGVVKVYSPDYMVGKCADEYGELCYMCLTPVDYKNMDWEDRYKCRVNWDYDINTLRHYDDRYHACVCKDCRPYWKLLRGNLEYNPDQYDYISGLLWKQTAAAKRFREMLQSKPRVELRFNPRKANFDGIYHDASYTIFKDIEAEPDLVIRQWDNEWASA